MIPVMKLQHFTPVLITSVALCAGSVALNAAEVSDPVGAVTITVPAGPTIMSQPFQKAIDMQGAVASISGNDVDMGSTIPTLAANSYLQVLTGANAGYIYNITASSGTTVTVDAAPAFVAGDEVAIRAHMTVADLGTPPLFTTLTLLQPGGTPFVGTYLFTGWDIPTDTVILPGEGFVINNGSAYDITLFGSVAVDDVVYEAAPGPAIVGAIDPVNGSADVLATVESGAPLFATITELGAGGTPAVYTNLFTGWDPAIAVDTSDLKTFVVNTGAGLDIVNAGVVVGP